MMQMMMGSVGARFIAPWGEGLPHIPIHLVTCIIEHPHKYCLHTSRIGTQKSYLPATYSINFDDQ